jgi:hypothetical protein
MKKTLLLLLFTLILFSTQAQQFMLKKEVGGGTLEPNNVQANQAYIPSMSMVTNNTAKDIFVATPILVYKVKPDGVITRIAGVAPQGYGGDNGPALNARFGYILAMAADAAGNVYVSDGNNYRIRKIGVNGIVTTIAGLGYYTGISGNGGPAVNAGISNVRSMATDAGGNLYLGDDAVIRKIDKDGIITHFAGGGTAYVENGPASTSKFIINSMATDAAGNIYFSDYYGYIRKITVSTGKISTVAGTGANGFSGDGGQATNAMISSTVAGIVVDKTNNIYFSDTQNRRIRKITTAGVISTVIGNGAECPVADGNLALGCIPGSLGLAFNAKDELLFMSGQEVVKLTLQQLPTIASFTPTKGAVNTEVTVTGTNFVDVKNIYIGTLPVTDYTIVDAKTIKLKVPLPSGAQAVKDIAITTISGTATKTGFTVIPPPVITSFTPTKGTDATIVTITGTGFVTGAKVTFGGVEATAVTVSSATSIKATVGAGTSGVVEVSGSTGSGSLSGFTHAKPVITSFTPQKAIAGKTIEIYGRNFSQGVTAITIGGVAVKSFNILGDSYISAVIGSVKTGKIRVTTTTYGSGNSIDTFTYIAPPTITSFTPAAAPTGTEVIITGTDFEDVSSVKFGDVDASDFTVLSPTKIAATVSTGASGSIAITTLAGSGSKAGFTFIPPIELTADNVVFCPSLTTVYPATIDIPIRVKNFKEMASLQGSFAWDGNILKYNSVVNLSSVLGITVANFNAVGNNRLSFVWHDAATTGKTLDDNAIMFTIRFNITGLATYARTTELDFTNDPLPYEAAHRRLSVVPVVFKDATITMPGATVITTNNSTTICAGEALTLSTNATGTLQWYKDDVLITGAKSSNYAAKSTGNYKVVATTAAGCVIPSAAVKVVVNAATPSPVVTVVKTPVNLGDTIKLKASTVANATNYIWTTPTGAIYYGKDLVLPNANAYLAGTYSVMAVVNGCNSKPATGNVAVNNLLVLSGTIVSPTNKPVANVTMALTGTQNISKITLADGKFSYQLPAGGNYTLIPDKNNDVNKTNGITALDITFIQAHLLQKTPFDSPYKLIAADANNSGSVSALDLVHIRRMILAIDTAFAGNRKWAFINTSTYFNTYNPFPYSSKRYYNLLNTSAPEQNFVGVKIGDVNYDWNPAILSAPQQPRLFAIGDNIEFYHDDIEAGNADNIAIPVKVKNFKDLLALQYTLGWNKEKFEYKGLRNNTLGIEFSDHLSANGKLTAVWNDPVNNARSLADGDILFELILHRKPGVKLQDESISINSDVTYTVAYDKNYTEKAIIKSTGKVSDQLKDIMKLVATFDMWPNPSRGDIKIQLYAKENKDVTIAVVDLLGKTVHQAKYTLLKGDNVVPVNLSTQSSLQPGNYFVQVKGLDKQFSRQIIIKKN